MYSPWDSVGFHYRTDKKKIRLIRGPKHRARWPSFFSQKYKGFSKFIKGKKFRRNFFYFYFKQFFSQNRMNRCDWWGPDGRLDTQDDQIDLRHISMSYALFVIIWHYMSYDAYDIYIWHQSIWLILVSKRPSGPQQSHLFIQCWLKNC